MISLTDDSKMRQTMYWTSYNFIVVTCSVFGIEVMLFTDAFHMALTIKFDLKVVCNQFIPISMMSDDLSFIDVLTRMSTTIEKCLRVDFNSVQKFYCRMEITDVAFIIYEKNFAYSLTKN